MFKKIVLMCLAILVTNMSFAAVFIKFDGVDGESNDRDHQDYSDVLAWSWGTNSDAKSTCIQDINIAKEVDSASPILLMGQVDGKIYPMVRLAVTTNFTDGGRVEYLILEMKNARMTSLSTSGTGGDTVVTENINVSFTELTYTYKKFDSRGRLQETIESTITPKGKCS